MLEKEKTVGIDLHLGTAVLSGLITNRHLDDLQAMLASS
jgi:hypothetical protein